MTTFNSDHFDVVSLVLLMCQGWYALAIDVLGLYESFIRK